MHKPRREWAHVNWFYWLDDDSHSINLSRPYDSKLEICSPIIIIIIIGKCQLENWVLLDLDSIGCAQWNTTMPTSGIRVMWRHSLIWVFTYYHFQLTLHNIIREKYRPLSPSFSPFLSLSFALFSYLSSVLRTIHRPFSKNNNNNIFLGICDCFWRTFDARRQLLLVWHEISLLSRFTLTSI